MLQHSEAAGIPQQIEREYTVAASRIKPDALLNDGIVILVYLVGVQLVQQALLHQRAGVVLSVHPVPLAWHVVVHAGGGELGEARVQRRASRAGATHLPPMLAM